MKHLQLIRVAFLFVLNNQDVLEDLWDLLRDAIDSFDEDDEEESSSKKKKLPNSPKPKNAEAAKAGSANEGRRRTFLPPMKG